MRAARAVEPTKSENITAARPWLCGRAKHHNRACAFRSEYRIGVPLADRFEIDIVAILPKFAGNRTS